MTAPLLKKRRRFHSFGITHDYFLSDILNSMVRIIFFMLILLCSFDPGRLLAADIILQDISVRLNPQEHLLHATVNLSLPDREASWPELYYLSENADIEGVFSEGTSLSYRFASGQLRVPVASQPAVLTFNYTIRYDDPVPQDIVGIEDPSYGVTATIMPEGAYLAAASNWHPRAAGFKNLFSVKISGPGSYAGVTAGRMTSYRSSGSGTTLTWQTDSPLTSLALAAGHYTLHRDDLDDIQLLVFFSNNNAPSASGYLESMREYLTLYRQLFGPYPYEKFAVVENFYPTGYGLPGWTLIGNRVLRLPFIRTTSLPHEIAHAWWGNAVEIDYESGNWGEGLATYVADYYLKELSSPEEALEYRRKMVRDYAALVTDKDDMPLSSFRSRMSRRDQAVGYGKAAMVFHMLRQLIGDEAFWEGLKNIHREGRGKRYGWSHLEKHFQSVADVELGPFFRQWITQPGAPRLSLSDVDMIKVASGWQVSGNISQGKNLYDLAVPLRLVTDNRVYEQVVGLTEQQDCFVFTVAGFPLSMTVDPDSNLFRRLYAEEIPATVNDLRASLAPLVVIATGSEQLQGASRDLLRGLQWHNADVINEETFLAKSRKERDVLFLGWPESKSLQPALPESIDASGHKFQLADKMEDNSDVLFMVRKREKSNHVMAFFLPGSIPAAKDTARRIPHYGRYSYLTFKNGQNLVKATWEPAISPLRMFFNKDEER